ncbi:MULTISPECIES: hypothetical protein [unclassified Paenibacillus]|uniref:hypothetical protein n=1 Tax=unclassified Paenibacillus TaxID=185978 RepID=UPI003632B69D
MKKTKMAFPWDDMTRILGPKIASNLQLLQKSELIESDIRGELKRHSGKPDAPPQGQPGYRIHEKPVCLIVNVPILPAMPRRNLLVLANSRSIRIQGLPGSIKMCFALPALVFPRLAPASFSHINLRTSNVSSARTTGTSRSNCPKDELYAERL